MSFKRDLWFHIGTHLFVLDNNIFLATTNKEKVRVIEKEELNYLFRTKFEDYPKITNILSYLEELQKYLDTVQWNKRLYKVKVTNEDDCLFAINTTFEILIILKKDFTYYKAANTTIFGESSIFIEGKRLINTSNLVEGFKQCELSYRNTGEEFINLL